MRAYRTRMTVKVMEKVQELNATLLKVIKKDSLIDRLLERLESKLFTLTLFSHFF
jgi:hypothetical protein